MLPKVCAGFICDTKVSKEILTDVSKALRVLLSYMYSGIVNLVVASFHKFSAQFYQIL